MCVSLCGLEVESTNGTNVMKTWKTTNNQQPHLWY